LERKEDIDMNILMVVPWFPYLKGSTAESQQGIFEYRQTMNLVTKGNTFRVITIRWHEQPTEEEIDREVTIHRINPIFIFPGIRYPIPNFINLSREIVKSCKNWKPDLIIYSHMIYLTTLPIFWLKKRTGIPSMVTTDVFPGISWFYGNKIVDCIGYLYSIFIGRQIFKLADKVQLLSSGLNEYAHKLNLDTNKTVTISRGVDTELFKPRKDRDCLRNKFGIKEEDIVILYVGRLDRVKGVNILLKAAMRILIDNKNIKFLIVGEGGLRKKYEKSAKYFSKHIMFTGWRNNVAELMNVADIFVLPSYSEGAANAAMEASASGLPVIATKVGEIPHIVSQEETGVLVKPKDVEGLVEAINCLTNDLSLARAMGERGRKRMVEKFSWDIICNRLNMAYQDMVEKF
jgi:glycosyltransferase involved in cell wall biosynthesis